MVQKKKAKIALNTQWFPFFANDSPVSAEEGCKQSAVEVITLREKNRSQLANGIFLIYTFHTK